MSKSQSNPSPVLDGLAGDLPPEAGGKARALSRLNAHGFNPPHFFVILSDAFNRSGLAKAHHEAVANAISQLGEGPFAVRSSGAQEDGAEHSHAGQFLSVLNVDAKDVAKTAHKVWKSGFADSISTYRKTRGLEEGDAAPSVVVQRMIDARAAGVAFSADPVSGARSRIIISAIEGLGESLVAGEEDGETWQVDDVQNAIVERPAQNAILTDEQALAVAALANAAEEAFGTPQDIEWAIDSDGLHILQARPITTKLHPKANSDDQVIILDNSNIVESYPGIVSPLTYSFARYAYARVYRAFVKMVGVTDKTISANSAVFDNMLARVDGRVYYNLVNWYRALSLLPGFSINRHHMETMMGVSEPLPEDITNAIGPAPATGTQKLFEYMRMGRGAFGLLIQAVKLPRTIRKFNERFELAIGAGALDLEQASLSQLGSEYRRIETLLLDKWDAPIVNDFLCMMAFGASRKMMERWFGPDGLELHNHVMIGQGDIISAEPPKLIAEMGRIIARSDGLAQEIEQDWETALAGHGEMKRAFDGYIDKFGDRCAGELKLESATLRDDPSSLLTGIVAASRRPAPERDHKGADDVISFDRVTRGKPIRGMLAKLFVSWAKNRVRDRENLRFERTRIFGRARQVFLAIGRELTALGHLESQRDIMMLSVEEVLGAIEGFGSSPALRPLVSLRKAEMEASSGRDDPPERFTIKGAAVNLATILASDFDTPQNASPDQHHEADGLTRSGVACSAGIVTATARVIRDPAKESLLSGEILVARHTDPGWISVFSNASAIVVERGSLLSHSAIVAREMGIPCVVALKEATKWIEDGEIITVDGGTGSVTRQAE